MGFIHVILVPASFSVGQSLRYPCDFSMATNDHSGKEESLIRTVTETQKISHRVHQELFLFCKYSARLKWMHTFREVLLSVLTVRFSPNYWPIIGSKYVS